VNCWDNYQFSITTCSWQNTGTQPTEPAKACYEIATFNPATCSWDVTGTQPTKPATVNCWDNYQFNTTTCNWENAGAGTTYYADVDGDGYGNPASFTKACSAPPNYVINNSDCNDGNFAIKPGTVEVCGNNIDDNCDGMVDENCGSCKNATSLSTANITTTSATMNWVANSNPAQWQVEYKSTNQGAKWVAVLLPGTLRSYTLNGLKANQNYQWHIRAKCGTKWTGYSNTISFKTKATILSGAPANSVTLGLESEAQSLEVKALPNPSTTYFTLLLRSSSNKAVSFRVVDAVGRMVESKNGIAANSTERIGHGYMPGVYFVQVLQDGKLVTLKLMKQAQ
jgi:hypothetical protein